MRRIAASMVLVVLLTLAPSASVVFASGNGHKSNWGDTGIGTEAWNKIPGKDLFGPSSDSGDSDPYMYKYVIACTERRQNAASSCIIGTRTCTAAKGGQSVDWFRSLKPPHPLVWTLVAGSTCIYSEKPRDVLADIAAQISHEFQKSPIQPATIGSQPGPHTLRGQETNFYATAQEQHFTITLLGQKVHITATPAAYTWNYGDGTRWGPTPSAGAPLPDERIGEQTKTSHPYTATGHYTITVTTHFNGTYTVNGGPSLPIPGQGNIPSNPLALTVWRAVTNNYADNCNQNPNGVGC